MGIEGLIFLFLNLVWEKFFDQKSPKKSGMDLDGVLVVKNLTKTYKNINNSFTAVDNINLNVERGECFGLIGLNGAGKSTTFQMITGKTRQTSGDISLSCDRIGYCPQSNSVDSYLTVMEQLTVYGMLAGYSSAQSKVLATTTVEKFSLVPYKQVRCGDLSGGNKRKVCSAISLIGQPQFVLMDEPTSGMDPGSRRLIWDNIKSAVAMGQSVMMTSHSMAECDMLCDRLAIMAEGKIKCTGNSNELKEKFGGGYKINIKLKNKENFEEINDFLGKNVKGITFLSQREKWLNYAVAGNISEVLGFLSTAKQEYQLEGFTVNMTSLDDIFMEVTNKEQNDNQAIGWSTETSSSGTPEPDTQAGYVPVQGNIDSNSSQSLEAAVYIDPQTFKNSEEGENVTDASI